MRVKRGVGTAIVYLATSIAAEAGVFTLLTLDSHGRWPGDPFSMILVFGVGQVGLYAAYRYWHASEFAPSIARWRPLKRVLLLAVVLLVTGALLGHTV